MATNILIGIGGTGAKIVESALYLFASGIGPADGVHVGLIDQDNANGNVQRTETLLNLIHRIQDELATGSNKLDWTDQNPDERTSLLSIPLRKLFADADACHWRPAPEKLNTLAEILQEGQMTTAQKDLFDLLFRPSGAAPADKEQDLRLEEGYRGRAHVGSAALLSALHHDSPQFLTTMTELMRNGSSTGNEVRIMLVGSLFGGTGAAGFPTIARSLDKLRQPGNKQSINAEAVKIGGALMLPYFSFSDPSDPAANVITTAQLLPQARVAVNYYDRLIEQEGVFDHLYIAGWDKVIDLNYHEPGRVEQCNPALLPEVVAAMGVADFFTLQTIEPQRQPMMAARRAADALTWGDLPISDSQRQTVFERLAQALRFAVVWRNIAEPGMNDRRKKGLISRTEEIVSDWIRPLTEGTDWQGATVTLRDDLKALTGGMIEWTASLRLFIPGGLRVELWNPEPLTSRLDKDRPQDPVDLHPFRSENETSSDLAQVVIPADPKKTALDWAAMYAMLHEDQRGHGKSTGLGRLIAAVHRAARPFHDKEPTNGQ
jgi:hypothetical protein